MVRATDIDNSLDHILLQIFLQICHHFNSYINFRDSPIFHFYKLSFELTLLIYTELLRKERVGQILIHGYWANSGGSDTAVTVCIRLCSVSVRMH